jgi:hypothetical protein
MIYQLAMMDLQNQSLMNDSYVKTFYKIVVLLDCK